MVQPTTSREALNATQILFLGWYIAFTSAVLSLVLWLSGVEQLAAWQGIFPAISFVASLFTMIGALRWRRGVAKPLRVFAGTAAVSACWSLAIAIGV